jgi:two-component system sensor histidine kinase ArlS
MSLKMPADTWNKPSNRIINKIRFSIVWKLNTKLFIRLLGIFLVLDLFLLVALSGGLLVRAEQTATVVAAKLQQTALPTLEEENWLKLMGYSISPVREEPEGFQFPKFLQSYLPEQTASGVRKIILPDAESISAGKLFQDISYNVTVGANNRVYLISYYPQQNLELLARLSIGVLIIQFLMLLGSISSGAKLIRRTLQPIQELAEKAQTFSTEGVFSPQQLQALAGELDNINAAKLDTRISIDETKSELQGLASAINEMLDRINEAYRSQVRFVSDASHELRTPIAVIQGYANLLDRWGKDDEKTLQESIDAIKEETDNMKSLVEQLLFLARGDNNTMTLQIESFDLSDLAQEVLRETEMIAGGHSYSSDIISVYVNADKSLIKQAIRILIDNAIKYTPTGKEISISVSRAGDFACLTVQDEGIGIEPESIPKIFNRFYRTDESRARATGGTGLGLAIAKWITERHGGHMEVLSRLNIGTRISIKLPTVDK